jgi:hypothetical protein
VLGVVVLACWLCGFVVTWFYWGDRQCKAGKNEPRKKRQQRIVVTKQPVSGKQSRMDLSFEQTSLQGGRGAFMVGGGYQIQ